MTDRRRIPIDEKGMPVRKEDVGADAEGCECPRLDREGWDGVESDWSDITFVKTMTNAVLGVPVGYDGARDELRRKAAKAGGTIPEDAMLLNGRGRFRRPVMLEVEGVAADSEVERPGGVAYTRIFEAPWGQLGKVAEETEREAEAKYGRKPDAIWIWYLTCRYCSKARNFETLVAAHFGRPR